MNLCFSGTRNYALPSRFERQKKKQSEKQKEQPKGYMKRQEMLARAAEVERFVFARGFYGVAPTDLFNVFGTTAGNMENFVSRHCYNIYEARGRLYHVKFEV